MSIQLLDKTRKINKLLHNNNSHRVEFDSMCVVLSEVLESDILVISTKGKILGAGYFNGTEKLTELVSYDIGSFVDELLNERFLGVLSTKENVNLRALGFSSDVAKRFKALVAPIDISGERLGTLFIYKNSQDYEIEDIILSEYGATVAGLALMSSVNEENADKERKKQIVQSVFSTLSMTEIEAIKSVFSELNGMEGTLVASRIADRIGITRSVIVSALKKFESAGVIVTKSLGMKGTYIRILNDVLFEQLNLNC